MQSDVIMENGPKFSAAMTPQQEDTIIHTRITNDEKALRRVTKKFHSYTSIAYNSNDQPSPGGSTSVDDARDSFLVELASFHLSLKKSLMVCEAEARQVEEYQRERERIGREQTTLKDEIETLKISLEQAQLERRRKMEYDVVAEKINALPTRDELEQSIQSLENDMAAIRTEHENQNRTVQAQKTKLDMIVADLQELRLMGKPELEQDPPADVTANSAEEDGSRVATPAVVEASGDVEMPDARTREETGELVEDKEEREMGEKVADSDEDDVPLAKTVVLNPGARLFVPRGSSSRPSTPVLPASTNMSTPRPSSMSRREEGEEEDIEMGELAEEPRGSNNGNGKKKLKTEPEELEEGEASDLSSELSEPPDD